jgi:hypothetical protein
LLGGSVSSATAFNTFRCGRHDYKGMKGTHAHMTVDVQHADKPSTRSFVRAERYEQCVVFRQRGPDTEVKG